jgi:hypothetical protein
MSKSDSSQFVRIVQGPVEPSGSGGGYLLIGLMALALVALDAYGFRQATELPPLIGISLAGLICVVRFFLIRRRSSHERMTSSNLERVVACIPASFMAVALAAFAIYSFSVSGTGTPRGQRGTEEQMELAIVAIESYYVSVRTRLNLRNNHNALRLSELDGKPPSDLTKEEKEEIERLEREQRELRALANKVVAGRRPNDPSPPGDEDSPGEGKPVDAEAALRARFDRAAELHGQLPEEIRNEVELPKLESPPVERIRGGKLERFLRETLSTTNQAIGCWLVPAMLEIFIIILVLVNRPRD